MATLTTAAASAKNANNADQPEFNSVGSTASDIVNVERSPLSTDGSPLLMDAGSNDKAESTNGTDDIQVTINLSGVSYNTSFLENSFNHGR